MQPDKASGFDLGADRRTVLLGTAATAATLMFSTVPGFAADDIADFKKAIDGIDGLKADTYGLHTDGRTVTPGRGAIPASDGPFYVWFPPPAKEFPRRLCRLIFQTKARRDRRDRRPASTIL